MSRTIAKQICRSRIFMAFFAVFFIAFSGIVSPPDVSAFAYHATSKALAGRIMKSGISPRKFNHQARFGGKFYAAARPSTAIAEKGKRSTLIRMKTSKYLKNNSWDLRRPKPQLLRRYAGNTDLRGTVKKGVIGPKLGHKIGRSADQKGKAIQYRSVKNGGTNIAVPGSMLSKHPRALYNKTVLTQ